MTQATNITIKNAANADVVLSNVTGAAGSQPAVWFGRTLGDAPAYQPKLSFSSSQNGPKVRRSRLTLAIPFTEIDAHGKVTVTGTDFFEITRTTHDAIPMANRANGAAYAASIMGNTLIKDSMNEGYAPN